jgi:hypothetical protein
MMEVYSKFRPTAFDPSGLNLPDQQDWQVVPVSRTRDSGVLDNCNFETALKLLGGESDDCEVHRFGHWGPGWFEIVIVRPGSEASRVAEDLERSLSDYPLLDEEAYSEACEEAYSADWESYAGNDFARALRKEFGLYDSAYDLLDDNRDKLREFYEQLTPSGEYYTEESSGLHIPLNRAAERCGRADMAKFLRLLREGV